LLPIVRGLLFVALVIFTINVPAPRAQTLSAAETQAMRSALAAAQIGDWGRAYAEAGATTDPLPLKMLRWMDYARPGAAGRFPEIVDFIEKNPDWPGHKALRRHAEEALAGESDLAAAEWLKRFPPISAAGRVREAEILLNSGDLAGGTEALRATWIGADFGPLDEKNFIARYSATIRPEDTTKRVDRLLWDGQTEAAHRMLPLLPSDYRALAEAAALVSTPQLRNMGTLGGNICLDTRCLWYNQSLAWRKSCGFCIKKDGDLCHVAPGGTKCWAVFSADTPAALLCLDAELEIVSARGTRRVALADFYADDGIAHVKLKKDELLTRVFLPVESAGLQGAYRKLRVRGSIDYPLAGVAVTLKRKGDKIADVRVAITGVNPAPLVVSGARKALAGKLVCEETAEFAGELAAKTARPLTTSALTPEYRNEMIRVLTKRALLSLN